LLYASARALAITISQGGCRHLTNWALWLAAQREAWFYKYGTEFKNFAPKFHGIKRDHRGVHSVVLEDLTTGVSVRDRHMLNLVLARVATAYACLPSILPHDGKLLAKCPSYQTSSRSLSQPSCRGDEICRFQMLLAWLTGYQKPCVLDVKMGVCTAAPDRTATKQARCKVKDKRTTTGSLGARICGLRVYQVPARVMF